MKEETGAEFQRVVQTNFLNNSSTFICSKNSKLQYKEIMEVYDCMSAFKVINESPNGRKSILFHFIQENHIAIDSMIYDENLKIMLLIQITKNSTHDDYYDLIWQLINNENPTINKKKTQEILLKKFFDSLRNADLVRRFDFQWLTPQKFSEIEKRKNEFFKNKIQKDVTEKFQICTFSKDLISCVDSKLQKKQKRKS